MAKRSYPAVFEPAEGGYGVSFPDLPGCVSFGQTFDEALREAEEALSLHLEGMAEDGQPFPLASSTEELATSGEYETGSALGVVSAETPDAVERINVYLPKNLVERLDRFTTEMGLGVSRSSFVAIALRKFLNAERVDPADFIETYRAQQQTDRAKRALARLQRPKGPRG